jgi:hypothetical protein
VGVTPGQQLIPRCDNIFLESDNGQTS